MRLLRWRGGDVVGLVLVERAELWVRRGQVLAGSSEGWWPPIQQPICVAYGGTDASEGNGNKYRTECFLKEQTVCF